MNDTLERALDIAEQLYVAGLKAEAERVMEKVLLALDERAQEALRDRPGSVIRG